MPQLCLRDIPDEINDWIDEQSYKLRTSKKNFVLSLLHKAWTGEEDMPLFAGVDLPQASAAPGLPFNFIDLFAGIVGMRFGLEAVGGRCIYTSEWDRYAQKTYNTWPGELPPDASFRKRNQFGGSSKA